MSGGVTFEIHSGGMRIPYDFYSNVRQYMNGLPMQIIKPMPNVSNPAMFIECLKAMRDWKDDEKNGYEIELSSDYKRFRKLPLWQK